MHFSFMEVILLHGGHQRALNYDPDNWAMMQACFNPLNNKYDAQTVLFKDPVRTA